MFISDGYKPDRAGENYQMIAGRRAVFIVVQPTGEIYHVLDQPRNGERYKLSFQSENCNVYVINRTNSSLSHQWDRVANAAFRLLKQLGEPSPSIIDITGGVRTQRENEQMKRAKERTERMF